MVSSKRAMGGLEGLVQYGIAAVCGLWLAAFVRLVWHETAHAVAALAVGFRVHSIVIGREPWLVSTDRWSAALHIGIMPVRGFVHCGTASRSWFRTRWTAVIAAGPLADAALLGVILLLADAADGTDSIVAIVLGVVLLVHGATFLASLWPRELAELGPNDVLHLWRIVRLSHADVDTLRRQERARRAALDSWADFRRNEPLRALTRWDAGVINDRDGFLPGRSLLVWAAHGPEAALEALRRERRELRAVSVIPPKTAPSVRAARLAQAARARALLYINEAFFCVEAGGPARLARAKWCMHLARTRMPHDAATLRTLGLVQLHSGDVDRGIANTAKALASADLAWGRSLSACYLAFGHALRGDASRAEEYLDRAARLEPTNRLLPNYRERVREALEDARRAA
jgi:hypothetical protein